VRGRGDRAADDLRDAIRDELAAALVGDGSAKLTSDGREADLRKVERELQGIVDRIPAERLHLFVDRLGKLEDRKKALEASLAGDPPAPAARCETVNVDAFVDEAFGVALRVRELLAERDDREAVLALRREVLLAFVEKIEPFPEEGFVRVTGYKAGVCATRGRGEPRLPKHANEHRRRRVIGPEILATVR